MMKDSEGKDWSIPNSNDSIDVPDELRPLFNKLGMQLRFHTISGKNEIITIAHMVQIAVEYSDKQNSKFQTEIKVIKAKLEAANLAINEIVTHALHDIPFHAYERNAAGCALANRLTAIENITADYCNHTSTDQVTDQVTNN